MDHSIVEFFNSNVGHKCGYCKNEGSKFSKGMWAHIMNVTDYQDLIDRGWRRSGQYCYKPMNNKCCCPMYTIRCDALSFRPSKSQKKVLRKFKNYVQNGQCSGYKHTENSTGNSKEDVDDIMHNQRQVRKYSYSSYDKLYSVKGDNVHGERSLGVKNKEMHGSKSIIANEDRGKEKRKASASNEEKKLEDWLHFTLQSRHNFEVRMVRANLDDQDFAQSLPESLRIYQKYQVKVHGDEIDKCNEKQFLRFLCKNSFLADRTYGAFHRQYMIDGRIIAVGVVDILPDCISSVYLYYDPDYSYLSLGTFTSLHEIALVRKMHEQFPSIKYYYLGFYIHSCQKMRYKGQFAPSFLCCPESYTWQPIEVCKQLLDSAPYTRFESNAEQQDENIFQSKEDVMIFFCDKKMKWNEYEGLVLQDEKRRLQETVEIVEYGNLVGKSLCSRLLLYRNNGI